MRATHTKANFGGGQKSKGIMDAIPFVLRHGHMASRRSEVGDPDEILIDSVATVQ